MGYISTKYTDQLAQLLDEGQAFNWTSAEKISTVITSMINVGVAEGVTESLEKIAKLGYVTRANLDRGLNNVSESLTQLISLYNDNTKNTLDDIVDIVNSVKDGASDGVVETINLAKDEMANIYENTSSYLSDTLETVSSAFEQVYQSTKESVGTLVSGLGDTLLTLQGSIGDIPGKLIEEVTETIMPLMAKIPIKTFTDIVESSGFAKVADNLISGFWNGFDGLLTIDKDKLMQGISEGFDIWMQTVNRTMTQQMGGE